jgi:hypothetical protein
MVDCPEAERYGERVWITEGKPWLLRNGAWVVMLKGYGSSFYLGFLEVVDEKDDCAGNAMSGKMKKNGKRNNDANYAG